MGQLSEKQIRFAGRTGFVDGMAFSADGTRAALLDDVGISLWNLNSDERVAHFPIGRRCARYRSRYVALSPDATLAVSASGDFGDLQIWDFTGPGEIWRQKSPGHDCDCVICSPDWRYCACVSAGTVHVWDLANGNVLHELSGLHGYVGGLALSPGSDFLLAGDDYRSSLWDLRSGKLLYSLGEREGPFRCVAISADGVLGACGSDSGEVRVWELASRKTIHCLPGRETVDTVEFSPDGKWVLTASRSRMLKIWDVDTGNVAQMLYFEAKSTGPCLAAFACGTSMLLAGTGQSQPIIARWIFAPIEPLFPQLPGPIVTATARDTSESTSKDDPSAFECTRCHKTGSHRRVTDEYAGDLWICPACGCKTPRSTRS